METQVCKCCGRELPLEQFSKNWKGYTSVCQECNKKNRSESAKNRKKYKDLARQLDEMRSARLKDFTPQELLSELARRGYDGTITFTEVHTMELSKFK